MQKEIWKGVTDFEEFYEVSNFSRVRSIERSINYKEINGNSRTYFVKEKIKEERLSKNGYVTIALCRMSKTYTTYLHRIVAIAFIPNPRNYNVVNHKNGIKSDNRIDNLEWCTSSYNNLNALNNNLRSTRKYMTHEFIGTVLMLNKQGLSNREISKELKKSYGVIQGIVSGTTYKRMR